MLDLSIAAVTARTQEHAQRSLTHVVSFTVAPQKIELDQALHTICEMTESKPTLTRVFHGHSEIIDVESWEDMAARLLAELC